MDRNNHYAAWGATLAALAAAGCGGGGGSAAPQPTFSNLTFQPEPGANGDWTPLRATQVSVKQAGGKTTVEVSAGPRKLTASLPATEFVDGQTFVVGQGADAAYEAPLPSGPVQPKSGGPWCLRGIGGFLKAKLSKGLPQVDWEAVCFGRPDGQPTKFASVAGPTIVVTNTGGGGSSTMNIQPVSEGGSVRVYGGTREPDWLTGTSATVDPGQGHHITTLTTGDGRTLDVSFDPAVAFFTVAPPQGLPVSGAVVLKEGQMVWFGSAGQVVVGATSHSLNSVTLSPDVMTGATGTLTLNGLVVR